MTDRRVTAVALAAGAILAVGGAGTAFALTNGAVADATPSAGSSYGSGTSAQGGQRGHGRGADHGMRPQILHGELVVQDPSGTGTKNVLVQSGTVTAKTATSVTVKSTDGFTVTWTIDSTTIGTLTDVANGDTVDARGTSTGEGAALAMHIHEEGVGGRGGRGGHGGHGAPGQDSQNPGQSKAPTVAPSPTA